MQHDTVSTNGIHLHVVKDGPVDGPLVILLHGFPEFWYGWPKQIPYLAQYSIDYCRDGRLVLIEEATHWVQHEEPQRVNQLLSTFLRDGES